MTGTASPALAFVGAGSLGQAFAALIARSGQAVTLLATPGTAARLLEAREIRLRSVVDVTVPAAPAPAAPGSVGVTADAALLPAGAGVIFLTKGHQLAGAVGMVRAAWPVTGDAAAWVAGLQNGVVKDDLLADAFGAERLVGGATILGAERGMDGGVTVTSLGATYFGEMAGGGSPRVDRAIAALQRAGIPAESPADIRSVLWSKACNAAGVFGVSVLARATAPQLFADPGLMRAYLALVRETAAVGAAYGVEVGNYANFPPIRTYAMQPEAEILAAIPPRTGPAPRRGSMPSMTQDLLAGRPMEVDQVFGDLVERAARVGVAVPHLTFVRDVLRGLDRITREARGD
jgi:2-dehydropantoate 2-reductase